MNFSYDGKTSDLIVIEEGFTFPSMAKQVQYNETEHASYRGRVRSRLEPFSFPVPFFARNNQNKLTRDEVNEIVNSTFYSNGPKVFKLRNSNWYMIGEFNGPYYLPNFINVFSSFELEFTSSYPYKFYNDERVQTANKTVTIDTKSQLSVTPLIELTGLTGDDVQVSISGDSFMRIRLTGNLPSNLTIDIPNERIYETNSGLDRLNLLRFDSAFEDFRINDRDVVVLTNSSDNARARLTYKELLL